MGGINEWLRGLWAFYLAYTDRPIHAASAATLAICGILVFVDPLFAILAIAAYVAPPVVLYVLEDDPGERMDRQMGALDQDPSDVRGTRVGDEAGSGTGGSGVGVDGDTDSDSDSDDGDTDADNGR